MDLVAIVVALCIITKSSSIAKTESLASLLPNCYTLSKSCRAIALCKFIGIGISLNGSTELFIGDQVKILDIISIESGCFCSRRALGNCSKAIPSDTLRIFAFAVKSIKYAILYAGFIKTFAGFIPYNFRHEIVLLLIIKFKHIVIEIVKFIMPIKTAH